MRKPENIEQYMTGFTGTVRDKLEELRRAVKKAAPQATEVISYGMPGFKINSVLVYFAGWDKHIGFYPGAGGIAKFKDELSVYKGAKGSVQFPLDEPLPLELVNRIVQFRIQEDAEISLARMMKKAAKK